jgi:glycosyltransferase involved in cell wall biosynthesis
MNIAFLNTTDESELKNSWLTHIDYVERTLSKYSGNVDRINVFTDYNNYFLRLKRKMYDKLFKKTYYIERTKAACKHFAKAAQAKLNKKKYDLIFSLSTLPVAYLETDIPIVIWPDATFAGMVNYYNFNLSSETIKDGNYTEKKSYENSDTILITSEWAARSVVNDYGIPEEKVKVVVQGANISDIPPKEIIYKRLHNKLCKLLFLGFDWERKGGEVAFNTMILLNKMGLETELTICGCTPPERFRHPKLKVINFLNRKNKEDNKKLMQLFTESNFLIVPSRSECLGMVFLESSAFGLPVITTNTGGIPTVVKSGINGFTFPVSEKGENMAEVIYNKFSDKDAYLQLCRSNKNYYEKELNWDTIGMKVGDILNNRIKEKNNILAA